MSLKNHLFALALAGATCSCFAVDAQDGTSSTERRLGLLKQASVLLQRKVTDDHEKNLGKVSDLVLDVANGRVPVVLVSSSSDEVTLVPCSSFSDASLACLVMNTDKKVFAAAPRVAKAGALQAVNESRLDECRRHFGQRPPQSEGGAPPKLASSSGLLGVPVRGQGDETLGTLKDIMVDLPFGRIVYYVIQPAADSAAPDTFYVVPPSVLGPGDSAGFVVLHADRARFLAGPSFQKEFWNDLAFPAMAAAVRKHYGPSAGAATPVQVAEVPTAAPDAAAGPPVRSDQEITRAVLTEIVRQARGFLTVKIAVTTLNGRVTLSGNVKSEGQRKQIVSAAEHVVGKANVENRLNSDVKDKTAGL